MLLFSLSFVVNIYVKQFHCILLSLQNREGEEPKPFYLHPCLATEATETEFLREAVEVLLVLLLPERLAGCETARHLLREAFTCTGVYATHPGINCKLY